jgi:hypothetical protein
VWGDRHVDFRQKFPGEKWRTIVMQQPAFVTKFQGEISAHFHEVAVKCHSNMRNLLFDLPGQILCEQSH